MPESTKKNKKPKLMDCARLIIHSKNHKRNIAQDISLVSVYATPTQKLTEYSTGSDLTKHQITSFSAFPNITMTAENKSRIQR